MWFVVYSNTYDLYLYFYNICGRDDVGTVQSAASEMGLEHRGARSLEWTCHAVSTSSKEKAEKSGGVEKGPLRKVRMCSECKNGRGNRVDVLRDFLLNVWTVWPEQLRASAVLLQVQRLGTRHSHTGQQP